ncbi:hypothetical protein HYV70_00335 [Candidatus Uhrbacteria bacterium]|nr:hypothetical protein [Candidatus Uhrbacteria bacterium]
MRRSFEQSLGGYNEIARQYEQAKKEAGFIEAERMAHVVDFRLDQEARRNRTDKQTQEAVLETQKYKQEIMTALHERFKAIERKEQQEVRKGQRLITMKEGKFVWDAGTDKGEIQVTLGELLTDQEWGVEYVLDMESVPRQIQKRFAVEQAKFQLRELLNEQIILNETGRTDTPYYLHDIYNQLAQKTGETQSGFLAERGVRTFLKKMVIDYGLPVEIIDADVFQDVMEKIDFSIRSNTRHRGVEVEPGSEHQKYLGFQFTTLDPRSSEPEAVQRLEKKKKQIKDVKQRLDLEVDDILLITVPSRVYGWAFRSWKESGSPPGGPDRLWPKEVRIQILHYALVNFIGEEQADQFAARVLGIQQKDVQKIFSQTQEGYVQERTGGATEESKDRSRFSVMGSRRFSVAPQLVAALSAMQKRASGKRDMQVKFQESIDSSEQRKTQRDYKGIKASELFDRLNRVLSEAGLREIDPEQADSIPPELSDFLSKAASYSDPRVRKDFVINKLFPSRSG